MVAAYREPETKCSDCELRKERLAKMLPFAEEKERRCPACLSSKVGLKWSLVCAGTRRLILENASGIWWWKKAERVQPCKVGTYHFHMRCHTCEHDWLMRTAYDVEESAEEKGKKG